MASRVDTNEETEQAVASDGDSAPVFILASHLAADGLRRSARNLPMYRCLTALAIMFFASGCKDRSSVDTSSKSVELPTMTIHADTEEKSMLYATVSNPSSSEISIPGFEDETIYGSYWYQGDKVINVPECGTGFWNSVIKIPAGQTRKLRLPLPRAVTRGGRYTVAVVYGGLGSSLIADDQKKVSTEQWIRHPDVSLNCRKMEAEVNLASK